MKILEKTILTSLFFLFVCSVCYAETEANKLVLDRIKAEEGDGYGSFLRDPIRNGIVGDGPRLIVGDGSRLKVKLRAGKEAKGEIIGIEGSPFSYASGTVTFRSEKKVETIIVSEGFAISIGNVPDVGKVPFVVIGEFLVDDSLSFFGEGKWDGRKEGSIHTLIGKITMFGYEFDSNSNTPLVFKMTREGYVYQDGTGTVKDLKSGEVYVLKVVGRI